MKLQSLLSTTALVAASFALAPSAFAQTTGSENEEDAAEAGSQPGDDPEENELDPQNEVELESGQSTTDEGEGEQVVVTGTRIVRPNLSSPVPVTSVTQEELPNQGQANIGDALNDLPSLRSTFSQQNSGRFIGTAGLNLLDLRGLGIERTLVLVNNRRHVSALPGDFIVDINTIPQDLVERIDIITGGSSAVYGSDAVAGVVNFVLKRDFDGFRITGQGGISSRGDRSIQFVSGTAGTNFADGRGNVAVSLEYTNAEPLFARQRDYLTGAFSGRNQFNQTDITAGEPQAGDGIPDSVFLTGVRNSNISNGGAVLAAITAGQCQSTATPLEIRQARCTGGGGANSQPLLFAFDAAGNLVPSIPTRDLRVETNGATANVIGGLGSTLNDTGILAVGQDRYTANLLARFDVTEAFKPFLEAKFVYQKTFQEGQPSFFQPFGAVNSPTTFASNQGTAVSGRVAPIRCDNAFLTPQSIAALTAIGRCTTVVNGVTLFNPAGNLGVGRFNVDFEPRRERDERETYRIVAGVQGDFNDDWSYEISGNYGRFENTTFRRNELLLNDVDGNPAGFLLAVDAVRNAQGQIVCRVNADLDPSNDSPGCVPINIFGEGRLDPAARDFVNVTARVDSFAEQINALAFVNGDLSQLFELPGGPIGFVIGGEYRREDAGEVADELSASGGTFFNAFQEFDPPKFEVKEVFGEVNIPILADLPFAEELSVSGAARYSDYNTSADKTFAYNVNGIYAPTQDIKFRGNYSKSVRVPTLGDLFSPFGENFAFIADPCDVNNVNNGVNRATNCAALGIPAGFINLPARSQTTGFLSGGNPDLEEEEGKSLTLGAVLTPRFLPGFSLTVDYFDIEVDNIIAVLGAQTIISSCVDLPTIDNPFCPLVNRNPDGTFADPAVLSAGINFARQLSSGIDVDLAYRRTFDNGHRLNTRAIATYTLERTNFVSPSDPDFANRQLSELGDPVFAANLNLGYGIGNFDLGYNLRYVGRQIIDGLAYEDFFELDGRPPANPDARARVFYPDVFYHDIRASYKVNNNFRAYFGVENIFDRDPPFLVGGTGFGSGIYSNLGRYFFAGAQIDF